jgi:UPF0716 family protein affecting phage T7 exclusion
LKFFALVILEVFLFTFFAEKYGFLNTLLAYWVPTFLGFSLLPRLGQGFQTIQLTPANEAASLHRVLLFLGCLLLITPLLTFRVIGIFLILPGFRHFLIWKLAQLIKKKMTQFQGGNGFYFFRSQGFSRPQSEAFYADDYPTEIKDVTPIIPQIEKPKH